MKKLFLSVVFLLSHQFLLHGLAQMPTGHLPFQSGEAVTYIVYYHWGFIWVSAGEVTFSADEKEYKEKPVYHFKGVGATYSKYDWFYRVRDIYESYSDTTTLQPYYVMRDVHEGSYFLHNEYQFNYDEKKIYSSTKIKEKPLKRDTLELPDCTFDALSMIYYSRCIDFSKHTVGDKIPLTIILDNEIHNIYIRYLGKEVLDLDEHGKYNSLKFSPLLVEGSIFKGGEGMTVWVSDDKNKVPLQIETEILVGSINVIVKNHKGLKHPFTSKIEE
ncbi:DUF3108 domain-containing protein [Bacteroidales bacterium AH-315-I05]|nr:DUF3108 domain-containing protein [Bacteroidales bacterium AH-315-I05]